MLLAFFFLPLPGLSKSTYLTEAISPYSLKQEGLYNFMCLYNSMWPNSSTLSDQMSGGNFTFYQPDDHVCHLVSCTKLIVVDSDDWNNPGNVLDKLLISCVEFGEVLNGNGRLALSLAQLYSTFTLFRSDIEVDDQIRFLPVKMIKLIFSPLKMISLKPK